MSKKLRITAFVLTLVMLLGMLPLSLFAADEAPAAVETESSKSALDTLADKATGSVFEMATPDDYKSKFTEDDATFNEGAFTSKGYVGTGSAGPNNGKEYFHYSDEAGLTYADKTSTIEGDINISYTTYNVKIPSATKYIVFQSNVMRGEGAVKDRCFLRLRLRLSNDTVYALSLFDNLNSNTGTSGCDST